MNRPPMTKKGSERLRNELDRLKTEERPRIIAAIAEARAHGDLKENAEYHAAREMQGFVEGRIQELQAEVTRLSGQVNDLAGQLTSLRRAAAEQFTGRVTAELAALAMPLGWRGV